MTPAQQHEAATKSLASLQRRRRSLRARLAPGMEDEARRRVDETGRAANRAGCELFEALWKTGEKR